MTLLESAPILGILVGVVNLHWRRSRGADIVTSLRNSPVTQTDLFAVCYALLINLFYLSRLPLHAMITVRYLIPSVPFLLYLVFRLRPVRTAVIRERTTLWLSCLTTVLLTLALGYITVLVYNPSVGEMMQIHAITSLAAAILAGGWAVMSTDSSDKQRIGGILLGVTVGVTGSFLLLSGILYFSSSRHYALGIIQALARSVWHV